MLNYLKTEITEFSENTFGYRHDPIGPLNHLKEEVDELIEAIRAIPFANPDGEVDPEQFELIRKNEEEEWADCLLLLLDSFRIRYGNETSYNKLLHFALSKLEVIKKRDWNDEPEENGIYRSKK